MNSQEAIENFNSVVSEGRWLQGEWHREVDGKHYLCLAAAFGKPGEINGLVQCPVNVLPEWLFELMPVIDDRVGAEDVPWLFKGFAERLDRMVSLTADTWERVRVDFMVKCLEEAAGSIKLLEMKEKEKVIAVIAQVIEIVRGKVSLEKRTEVMIELEYILCSQESEMEEAIIMRVLDVFGNPTFSSFSAMHVMYATGRARGLNRNAVGRSSAEFLFAAIDAEL